MSKKISQKDKLVIAACLDEIDASMDGLDKKISLTRRSVLEGWVRKQKLRLKELKYKGKIRRKKRS